jgi:hypothetical protein
MHQPRKDTSGKPINAAGVLQVPLAVFVWDDGYGISVPKKYQTTKGSISEALKGFKKAEDTNGFNIFNVKGWDYAALCETFEEGIRLARETHTPTLFHVEENTQPQGHSTSGSHERYKGHERLEWEKRWDGMVKMREWIIANALATHDELETIEQETKDLVRRSKNAAWERYLSPIKKQVSRSVELLADVAQHRSGLAETLDGLSKELASKSEPLRRDVMRILHQALIRIGSDDAGQPIKNYYNELLTQSNSLYSSHLYHEGEKSALKVAEVRAVYDDSAPSLNGFEVLNQYFDQLFAANHKVIAFR